MKLYQTEIERKQLVERAREEQMLAEARIKQREQEKIDRER